MSFKSSVTGPASSSKTTETPEDEDDTFDYKDVPDEAKEAFLLAAKSKGIDSHVGGTSSSSSSAQDTAQSAPQVQGTVAYQAIIRPPRVFDNVKEKDFLHWVSRFERFCALTQLPPAAWTTTLLMNLGTEPHGTAKYLGITDQTPWEQTRKRLVSHYSPKETLEELRTRFQQRRQESGETPEDFARDLRVLAAKAFPKATEDMLNILMVQQFIHGLRDHESRMRLIMRRCSTLQDALNAAKLSEVANKEGKISKNTVLEVDTIESQHDTSGSSSNFPQHQSRPFGRNPQQPPNTRQNYLQSFGPNNSTFSNHNNFSPQDRNNSFSRYHNSSFPRSDTRSTCSTRINGNCWNCGEFGHRSRECRQPRTSFTVQGRDQRDRRDGYSQNRNSPSTGQQSRSSSSESFRAPASSSSYRPRPPTPGPNGRSPNPSRSNSRANTTSVVNEVSGPHSKQSTPNIFVHGEVNNVKVSRMLVDTGSRPTLMSQKLFMSHWPNTEEFSQTSQVLTSANKSELDVCGKVCWPITVANQTLQVAIFIVKDLAFDFILGNSFLIPARCDLLHSQKLFKSSKGDSPLIYEYRTVNAPMTVTPVQFTLRGTIRDERTRSTNDNSIIRENTVTLWKECTIAPHEETILVGMTGNCDRLRHRICEFAWISPSLLVARCLVDLRNSWIPLRVLNTSNEPIKPHSESQLGRLDAIQYYGSVKQVVFAIDALDVKLDTAHPTESGKPREPRVAIKKKPFYQTLQPEPDDDDDESRKMKLI